MRYLLLTFLTGCGMGLTVTSKLYDEDTASIDEEDQPSAEPETEPSSPSSEPGSGPTSEPGSEPDSNPDTGNENTSIVISNISPNFGSTSGGTTVTITGGPFDTSTTISFDGYVGTIMSNNGSTIQVVTPSFPAESTADVQINTSIGTRTEYAGFTYFADGSGQTGMIGYLNYLTLTGTYWDDSTYESASGMLTLLQPSSLQWWQLSSSAMGSCVSSNYEYTDSIYIIDPSESALYLQGSSNTISLFWDPTTYLFSNSSLNPSELPDNSYFTLSPLSQTLKGFTVSNLAQTSQTPIVTSPSISGSSPPNISQNQSFSWVISGASWIIIRMGLTDPNSTSYVDEVTCVTSDSGYFTVDSSKWNTWISGNQVDVYFTRAIEQVTTLPHNNSNGRIVGEYTLIGAGFAQ